jgi:hypothetical protein
MVSLIAAGGYRSLVAPGRPFSRGVAAEPGFDMVHAVFRSPVPLWQGLEAAARHVEGAGRPVTAIAGFELRIRQPLRPEEFDGFNAPYAERLAAMGLTSASELVAARTNVAPVVPGVTEPCVHAFTYSVPDSRRQAPAFRLSGATETRRDGSDAEKLRSIVDELESRMAELGVSWADATAVSVYAGASGALDAVRDRFGTAGLHGLTWFPSHPPLVDFEFEIDAAGVGAEITL